jgi:hypothetical protein
MLFYHLLNHKVIIPYQAFFEKKILDAGLHGFFAAISIVTKMAVRV